MADDPISVDLARLGHRIWCEKMLAEGWRAGAAYDEDAKIHDALIPFDDLPRRDRLGTILNVECEQMARRLGALAVPDRSPDALFGADELEMGLTVDWVSEGTGPPGPGTVEAWESDENGDLTVMIIRWVDGTRMSIDPFERVLRRLPVNRETPNA